MDREIYALKVYSTRMEYDSFQLELTPKENEEANDYYGMIFNVTVWCRGQMCAKLWGKLYDENLVYSCGMEEKWQNIQGFSGYIQGVFVVPQYRRRGIASYLLTHLDKILRHAMNIRIRAVGISPMPIAEMDGDVVEDTALLTANRELLEECGYHEIMDLSLNGMMYGDYDEEEALGTGYFVRVYPA